MTRSTIAGVRLVVAATSALLVTTALPAITTATAAPVAREGGAAKATRFLWDDFGSGSHPSPTYWSHRNYPAVNQGTCKRNATEPYKRSRSRSNNSVAKVGGGNLRLLAQERPCKNRPKRSMHYTGQIGTEGKIAMVPGTASVFTLSARIKMPKTSGNFASLWTRSPGGAGDPQEIDVIESFGFRAGCKLRTNYYPRYDTDAGEKSVCLDGRRHVPARPWNAFHTYTAVWRPGVSMTIKIDGHKVHKFGKRYTPTLPQFVILSNLLNDKASIRGKKSGSSMVVAWVHGTLR
jgi:hypothetical protein